MITNTKPPKARRKAQGSTLSRIVDRLALAIVYRFGCFYHRSAIVRAASSRAVPLIIAEHVEKVRAEEEKQAARDAWRALVAENNALKKAARDLVKDRERKEADQSALAPFSLMPLDSKPAKSTKTDDAPPPWTF